MTRRPYTVLSCCISLDGYLDDATAGRLRLSNDLDFARVDQVRAGCDAILVGAETIRRDDPRLLIRSPEYRADRLGGGRDASPRKVTVTRTGVLDPSSRFFTAGSSDRIVYCASPAAEAARSRLGSLATVCDAGAEPSMAGIVEDLAERGVARLLVEGGGSVLTQFLTAGLADELQLAVAPVFVGDPRSPRFVGAGRFPWSAARRARLIETRAVGDVALLRYRLSARATDPSPAGAAPGAPTAGGAGPAPETTPPPDEPFCPRSRLFR